MRLTVLLPSLNEAEGIRRTIARVPREALRAAGYELDLLVVDGSSTDGTPEAARSLGARVVDEPRRGYGRAYKRGFAEAQGEIVVTGDADDTYPFDVLPDLLARVRSEGLDFVTVNRFANMQAGSMSLLHRFGNRVLSVGTRALFRARIRDSQSGMWILSRRALERIPWPSLSDGMAFSQEIKIAAFSDPTLRCAEVDGRYYPRVGEEKLMSWRDGLGNLRRLVAFRFRRPPSPRPGPSG